ncbi:MAG: alpha/beta hydrolase [Anaerolineaceae bacterium]|nr:alpha/beta hydrolase [Anaerolineaceae bacterium]
MNTRSKNVIVFALMFVASLLISWSTSWAQSIPDRSLDNHSNIGDSHEPAYGNAPAQESVSSIQSPLHVGSSPYALPESNDTLFLTDTGPFMDQYLFRSDGPIEFTVEVGRVVGRTDGQGYLLNPQQLIDNGIISEKVQLQLVVWDVDEDYSGTEIAREIDRVYVNGNYIGNLSGANDTWSVTSFDIDVRYLKFAIPTCREYGEIGGQQYLSECSSPPTPVLNEIRIDIDTANSDDEYWAVEVDWANLSFEAARPILFVHGKGGSPDSSEPCNSTNLSGGCTYWDAYDGEYFFNFRGKISSAGFLTAITENFLWGEDSIAENAKRLESIVQDLKDRYGVERINLVGHSKGGLDSRGYVSNSSLNDDDDIAVLITLASPHHGSYLADLGTKLPAFALGWIGYKDTPALNNVSEEYMDHTFNPNHPANEHVQYYSVGVRAGQGSFPFESLPFWQINAVPESSQRASAYWVWNFLLYFGKYNGHNDYLVTVPSTEWSGIPGHNNANSQHIKGYQLNHHSVRAAMQKAGEENDDIVSLVKSLLGVNSTQSFQVQQQSFGFASQEQALALDTTSPANSALSSITGTISESATITGAIGIDGQTTASIALFWQDGELDLDLVDPNGNVITPTTQDPDIYYAEDRSNSSTGDYFITAKLAVYTINTPLSGEWQARIIANGALPSGQTNWVLLTTQDSSVVTSLTTETSWVPLNSEVNVFAEVSEDDAPLTGADVEVTVIAPSEATNTISLYDDGSNGDATAGDGTYTNSFVGTEFGTYKLSTEVNGTASTGVSFQRVAFSEIQVASGTALFSAGISDNGIDTDGDSLINIIRINVPIEVNVAGEYMISGVLYDTSENIEVENASKATEYLPGSYSVVLDFDASTIWANGGNGTFSLRDLRLVDQTGAEVPVQVDLLTDAYTTQNYSSDALQHPLLSLTGLSDDLGVDSNGNGKFEILWVGIEIYVGEPGTYSWNARLVDEAGQEFGWYKSSGYLSSGNKILWFGYEGGAINESCRSGLFHLKDFAMFGPAGQLIVANAATTSIYSFGQFEPVPGQLACEVYMPTILK